jgi:phage terminase large subunit-like protein
MRLGSNPRIAIATTPRPTKLIRELVKDPGIVLSTASTFDNAANLAPSYLARMLELYDGTRLGQQELYAKILDDIEGAYWTMVMLEAAYVKTFPEMQKIVVAIDPAISTNSASNETGIIVAGRGVDDFFYVLDDKSLVGSPDAWATAAIDAFDLWEANLIVAEKNQGGDMVEHTLRTVRQDIPYKSVHASRGKVVRAEPVVALYEQDKVRHFGSLAKLEDQMLTWVPSDKKTVSPDRIDALVWAITELNVAPKPQRKARSFRYV